MFKSLRVGCKDNSNLDILRNSGTCPPAKYPAPPAPPRQIPMPEVKPCMTEYKIFTKDDYVRYNLSALKACEQDSNIVDNIINLWDKISKGYNFIIGVGINTDLMFYSVEYFNDNVLGQKKADPEGV
ncbi:hypothetical protein [Rhodopseudomonas parapalustris]